MDEITIIVIIVVVVIVIYYNKQLPFTQLTMGRDNKIIKLLNFKRKKEKSE